MTIGSLFSGIGGLELGLEQAIPGSKVLWQCDSDPYSRVVLEAHWPDVRRYTDVKEIDEEAAKVDIICGGFPCQPHSVAGKRRGTSDARWLWPEFARIIGAVRPRYVFIENVPGLRNSGLRDVLANVAALGFDAEWDVFSAAEVGASHRRKRLFILAYPSSQHLRFKPGWSRGEGRQDTLLFARDGENGDVAHADGNIGQPCGADYAGQGQGGWNAGGGDPDSAGLEGRSLRKLNSTNELPPWPPGPEDQRGWKGYLERWHGLEPALRRGDAGLSARVDRLRLLGNSCVPQTAAFAFLTLRNRIYPM